MESEDCKNSTRLSAASVRILSSSRLTDAVLSGPVRMASPLLKRTFSMTKRGEPVSSSISTVPS